MDHGAATPPVGCGDEDALGHRCEIGERHSADTGTWCLCSLIMAGAKTSGASQPVGDVNPVGDDCHEVQCLALSLSCKIKGVGGTEGTWG